MAETCDKRGYLRRLATDLHEFSYGVHGALVAQTMRHAAVKLEDYARGEAEICICAGLLMPNGYVIRGHRHDDCMVTMGKMFPQERATQQMQGFVTSRNRWVSRYEGAELQRAAGIPSRLTADQQPALLFSEDLY